MDLAERLLFFRALPAGGTATAQDLLPLAEAARDIFVRRGTLLFERDHLPERFVCLVEGVVELSRGDLVIGHLAAPAVVGIRAVMARVAMPYTVRALDDLVALEVASDQFLQNIEDDFALWRRQLKFQNTEFLGRIRRAPQEHLGVRRIDLAGLPVERSLDLVERMLLVRRMGLFGRGSVNALAELAQQLVDEKVKEGDVLFHRTELATGPRFLVRGNVRGTLEDGQTIDFGPGSVLGGPETMAETNHLYDAVATTDGAMLRLDLESFFDIVEDNTEIASAFLSGTARVVLELDVARMTRDAEDRRTRGKPTAR